MPSTITVRGYGEALAMPDSGSLTLSLTSVKPTAAAARADVARRSAALAKVLDDLEVPKADRLTTNLSSQEEREYVKGEYKHRGYRATASVQVSLTDTTLISSLMTAAIEAADADVSGPYWYVRRDNEAHTEARKDAVADARRRADAYVEALGVRIVGVLEVSEPGLRERRTQIALESSVVMERRAAEPDIEVDTGDLDIGSAVELVYEIA